MFVFSCFFFFNAPAPTEIYTYDHALSPPASLPILNAGSPVSPPRAVSPPSMSLFALGINHQTAPVALRERVAISDDAIAPALAALRALPQVREVALLSTCNRPELYAVADDAGRALPDWLGSEGRRVGKEGVSACGSGWVPYHKKK